MKVIKAIYKEPGKMPKVIHMGDNLATMQKLVDGYIDIFQLKDDDVDFVVNDEGKLIGLPYNFSIFYKGQIIDAIMGSVLLVGHDDEGNTVSIPDHQVDKYIRTLSAGRIIVENL